MRPVGGRAGRGVWSIPPARHGSEIVRADFSFGISLVRQSVPLNFVND
jgi:hypothetical protein